MGFYRCVLSAINIYHHYFVEVIAHIYLHCSPKKVITFRNKAQLLTYFLDNLGEVQRFTCKCGL